MVFLVIIVMFGEKFICGNRVTIADMPSAFGYVEREPGCLMKNPDLLMRGIDVKGPSMITVEPLYHADWFKMTAKDAQAAMDHYNAKAALEEVYHRRSNAEWLAQTEQGSLESMAAEIIQMHERARWHDMNRQIGRLLVENYDMKIGDAFREALHISGIERKYPEGEPVVIYLPQANQAEEVSYDTFVQSVVIPKEFSRALKDRKVYDWSGTKYTKKLSWGEVFGTEGEHFHITVPNPPSIQDLITHNREVWGRIHGTWDSNKRKPERVFASVSGSLEGTILVDALKKMSSLERRVEISSVKLEDYKTPWGTYDLQSMVRDCGVDLRRLRKKS